MHGALECVEEKGYLGFGALFQEGRVLELDAAEEDEFQALRS